MRWAGVLALALVLLAPAALAAPHEAEIDAIVTPSLGAETPGLAVLVTRHGKTLIAKGYGLADLEKQIPVTPDTVFDLASVSKQMTALVALRFARDGRLDLDAPLHDALPGFQRPGEDARPITALDLIHHVSGLPDYTGDYTPVLANDDVVAWASVQKLDFAPGTAFSYSNTGYVVLASALAQVAGAASFGAVLQDEIFAPLGMTATAAPFPRAALKPGRVAIGYTRDGAGFAVNSDPGPITGDGSVFTSVNDLARYEAALDGHRLLDADATARLFANGAFEDGRPLADEDGDGYGFGWSVGDNLAWHSGSWSGTSAYYLRELTSGVSVIVLANADGVATGDLACAIAQLYGACE